MPKALSKSYNLRKKIWHRFLRRPITLSRAYDRKVKNPELTVIFLHGISATSDTWRMTFKQFSKAPELKRVRLIALDLLGFGKSLQTDWLDYDYNDYETALEQTLIKLKITGPVVIVGHSMGSLIAASFAVTKHSYEDVNIVRLILVSPPVLMSDELARMPDRVYSKSYGSLQKLAKEEPVMEVIANLVQRFSSFNSSYIKTPAFGRSMEQVILNPKNFQTFCKLKTPTLIVHGHFDPLVMRSNLKQVAIKNPNVRFISVIGHHDISAQKRSKIFIELKQVLREEKEKREN